MALIFNMLPKIIYVDTGLIKINEDQFVKPRGRNPFYIVQRLSIV